MKISRKEIKQVSERISCNVSDLLPESLGLPSMTDVISNEAVIPTIPTTLSLIIAIITSF